LLVEEEEETRQNEWGTWGCRAAYQQEWAFVLMCLFLCFSRQELRENFILKSIFFPHTSQKAKIPKRPLSQYFSLSDRSHTSISHEVCIKTKVNFFHYEHEKTNSKCWSLLVSEKECRCLLLKNDP
jgi:hypothetical protein